MPAMPRKPPGSSLVGTREVIPWISSSHPRPLCAEDISRTAKVCPFCGAEFAVTTTGYCTHCHDLKPADDQGRCPPVAEGARPLASREQAHSASKKPPVAAPPTTSAPFHPAPSGQTPRAPDKARKKNTRRPLILASGSNPPCSILYSGQTPTLVRSSRPALPGRRIPRILRYPRVPHTRQSPHPRLDLRPPQPHCR